MTELGVTEEPRVDGFIRQTKSVLLFQQTARFQRAAGAGDAFHAAR
jgi:hypothetical protein